MESILEREKRSSNLFREPLGDMCAYALEGGQRLRPNLLLAVAGARAHHFALFIEYIHNASLIIDDLPCMDNAETRRGQLAVYRKFGEKHAQLCAGKLKLGGLHQLYKGLRHFPSALTERVEEFVYKRLEELYDGQYHDLNHGEREGEKTLKGGEVKKETPRQRVQRLLGMVESKTGSLFSLALCLGYVYRIYRQEGEPTAEQLEQAHRAGRAIGVMYQIIDDLRDYEEEKNLPSTVNLAVNLRQWELDNLFREQVNTVRTSMEGFFLGFKYVSELVLKMLRMYRNYIK